jgi:glyoxylase-like metal-dependent hydrolase (beta-lactamase superfamily II)
MLVLLPVSGYSGERGPAVPDYPADKVADNVYVIHGPPDTPNPANPGFMNNPGIFVTTAGVVPVDPGSSVQSGEMVLRVAKQVAEQPVVAVFNTHIHGDHWLGDQAVRVAYPDVRIYGHPSMIELIEKGAGQSRVTLMEQLTEGKTQGTTVIPPNKPDGNGDVIKACGHTFRIHHYGPAHSTSDMMSKVVAPDLIFLGDNVLSGRVPRINEGSIKGNIKTCKVIAKVGASVYVPGHGKSAGHVLVDVMNNRFRTIYSNVERQYEEGQSEFEMKEEVSVQLRDYYSWVGVDEQLGKHISDADLQIEADAILNISNTTYRT